MDKLIAPYIDLVQRAKFDATLRAFRMPVAVK
jgi:hypothetical protein